MHGDITNLERLQEFIQKATQSFENMTITEITFNS